MKRYSIPDHVHEKLLQLEQQVEFFQQKVADNEQAISVARDRLDAGMHKQAEYYDLDTALKTMLADKPILQQRLSAAQSVLAACKSFIEQLPDNMGVGVGHPECQSSR
jgi:hypothetical protein